MTEKTCANCNNLRWNDWHCIEHNKPIENDYDICDNWESVE